MTIAAPTFAPALAQGPSPTSPMKPPANTPTFSGVHVGEARVGGFFGANIGLYGSQTVGDLDGYTALTDAKAAAVSLSAAKNPAIALFEMDEKYFAVTVWRYDSQMNIDPVVEPYRVGAYGEKRVELSKARGLIGIFDGEFAVMKPNAAF